MSAAEIVVRLVTATAVLWLGFYLLLLFIVVSRQQIGDRIWRDPQPSHNARGEVSDA